MGGRSWRTYSWTRPGQTVGRLDRNGEFPAPGAHRCRHWTDECACASRVEVVVGLRGGISVEEGALGRVCIWQLRLMLRGCPAATTSSVALQSCRHAPGPWRMRWRSDSGGSARSWWVCRAAEGPWAQPHSAASSLILTLFGTILIGGSDGSDGRCLLLDSPRCPSCTPFAADGLAALAERYPALDPRMHRL